jgi:hypothetical protein
MTPHFNTLNETKYGRLTAMSSFVKTTLLLLLALGVGAALLALNNALSFYKQFIYCFVYSLLYGWALYIPFAPAYAALARRWPHASWLAMLLGTGLATVLSAPLWASPSFPAFSGSHLHDAISWAGAGAFYGLVHYVWIARNHKRIPT